MPKRDVYHVVQNGEDWSVKKQGNSRATSSYGTQKDAIQDAIQRAKDANLGQVKIHGTNGRIRTEYTYGEDPRRYKS